MKVLFVCEGNMMRSQIAEAMYNQFTKSHDATSAGAIATKSHHISMRAKAALDEIGIDSQGQYSKQLTLTMIDDADVVILFPTDFMPTYALNNPKAQFWDVIDPHYHQEQGMELVRRVREDIRELVEKLIKASA